MIKPTVLQVLAEKHDDWIRMASSFGLSDDDVQEIVQEMYICVENAVDDVDRIMYNNKEVNTFYVYTALKHLHWQGFHKAGRSKKRVDVRYFSELKHSEEENDKMLFQQFLRTENSLPDEFEQELFGDVTTEYIGGKIDKMMEDWHWYDKKIFNLYFKTGISMRKLASDTTISLSSIFNTISNGRGKIKKKLKKDWEIYNNN